MQFRDEQRHLNQFIAHSSLDLLEEIQWAGVGGAMYLKCVERFAGAAGGAFGGGGGAGLAGSPAMGTGAGVWVSVFLTAGSKFSV